MATSSRYGTLSQEEVVRPFSILTCLFVGASTLVAETLIDYFFYPFGGHALHVARTTIAIIAALLAHIGIRYVLAWGVFWCLPVVPLCVFVGYKTGTRGLLYASCGVLIYLIIIHNFRGFSSNRQVFEMADELRNFPIEGDPSVFGWDALYVIVALISSTAGWICRLFSKSKRQTQANAGIGLVATLWSGWLCTVVGAVTALVIAITIQPMDIYSDMPRMTYGYAMLTYGIAVLLIVKYRSQIAGRTGAEIV